MFSSAMFLSGGAYCIPAPAVAAVIKSAAAAAAAAAKTRTKNNNDLYRAFCAPLSEDGDEVIFLTRGTGNHNRASERK